MQFRRFFAHMRRSANVLKIKFLTYSITSFETWHFQQFLIHGIVARTPWVIIILWFWILIPPSWYRVIWRFWQIILVRGELFYQHKTGKTQHQRSRNSPETIDKSQEELKLSEVGGWEKLVALIHAKGIGVKGSEFKFSFLGTRFSDSGVKTLKLWRISENCPNIS